MKRISEKKWKWFGHPQHFIGASKCHFHMATLVGDVMVSSIGAYQPDEDGKNHPMGCGPHEFETAVFKAGGIRETCGCCPEVTDWCEVEGRRSMTAEQCQTLHMEFCNRAAKGEWQP